MNFAVMMPGNRICMGTDAAASTQACAAFKCRTVTKPVYHIVTRTLFLVSGFWFLVSGFWFLVSGFWFLRFERDKDSFVTHECAMISEPVLLDESELLIVQYHHPAQHLRILAAQNPHPSL